VGESRTPEELAIKILRTAKGLGAIQQTTVAKVAALTKTVILSGAEGSRPRPRSNWIQITPPTSGSDPKAYLDLRGGFAFLVERGSYKHPTGYEIGPKSMTSRRRGRLRRQQGLTRGMLGPVNISGSGVNATGFLGNKGKDFAAAGSVHHPPERAQPFWHRGVDRASAASTELWVQAARSTIGALW